MTLEPGMRLGPYEVTALLGAGGMGEVWRARDKRVDRAVALKVLPEEFFESEERRARFELEAKLLASLNHPGIATLHSFEEIPSSGSSSPARHILVMELLEGETLRERLRGGPLPVRRAVDVAVQMARALAAAHEKGIVHRDLKPENVFLTKDGRVKILDFGLAKLSRREEVADAETASALTEAGAVFGTVGYMSPEQVRGEPVDHRSDVFSFGTILYELLTGKNPFRRDTHPETLTAILKDEPPSLVEAGLPVTPALSGVVARCLEKNPATRFQSSQDLAFGLETLAATGISSPPGQAPTPLRRAGSAWRLVAVAAGTLLAVGGAYLLGTREASAPMPSFQRLTFRRGSAGRVRFAPDGQSILYGATWEGGPVHVYTARIGNPETSPVVETAATLLSVSRSGELALALKPSFNWISKGTLARVPLGGGAPREILEGVSEADFSPDGSELAITRLAKDGFRIELPAGTPLYHASQGRIAGPRFSRDGRRIAFLAHPRLWEADGDVAVVDRAGKMTVLSKGWRNVAGLAWSPRGDEVWFTGSRTSRGQGALHAVTPSGRERVVARWAGNWFLQDVSPDGKALLIEGNVRHTTLISSPAGNRDLSWFDWSSPADMTPDGKFVLLLEWGQAVNGRFVTYLRATDGSPPVRLGEGNPLKLTRDGKWALVYRDAPAPGFVMLPVGAGMERALPPGAVTEFGRADFFPDGKRLLFAGAQKGRSGLYVQDPESGPPRPFGPEGLGGPLISPDGRLIATTSDDSRVRILTAEGEMRQELTLPADATLIGWAEDGRSLYFSKEVDGLTTRVARLDLASGRSQLWREIRPQDPAGVVAPPWNVRITPDGGSVLSSHLSNLTTLYLVEGLR